MAIKKAMMTIKIRLLRRWR